MPLIFGSLFLFGEEESQSILRQQGKHFGASSIHSYNSTDSQVQSFFWSQRDILNLPLWNPTKTPIPFCQKPKLGAMVLVVSCRLTNEGKLHWQLNQRMKSYQIPTKGRSVSYCLKWDTLNETASNCFGVLKTEKKTSKPSQVLGSIASPHLRLRASHARKIPERNPKIQKNAACRSKKSSRSGTDGPMKNG